MSSQTASDRSGLAAAFGCFVAWGLFPLLFDAMARAGASAWEIVGWRTLCSIPFALILVSIFSGISSVAAIVRQPRVLGMLIVSAALIAVNWTVYIVAVATGHTLAASLGYYINPLISLALGATLFRERVSRWGWAGFILSAFGVLVQAFALKALPWIPLLLALSFASYGAVRKKVAADASVGLLIECLILAAPALALVVAPWASSQGFGPSGAPPIHGHSDFLWCLLFLSGPVTVAPLAAFSFAARRLPLATVGFLQFITPTLQFLCGLALGERLAPLSLLAFAFIWAGVLSFSWGNFRDRFPIQRGAPASI